MKLIRTVDAKGTVLCHDIAQIIRGVTKGAVLRKDHVVTKEDIPVLLGMGKDQLYMWEKEDGMLHGNGAVEILYDMCRGQHMGRSQTKEGEIELTVACDDFLKVSDRGFKTVNGFGQMAITTCHGNFAVRRGDELTRTRIIPPVTEEERMEAAKKAATEAIGGRPTLELKLFLHRKVGIVIAGNEVFYGRIKDIFTPVIRGKLSKFDIEVTDHVIWNDDDTEMMANILNAIQKGAGVVAYTGSMSVDPDDKAPLAIRNTRADIISYGAPVLPGAIFLLAYYQVKDEENSHTIATVGLPGCAIYTRRTIFDLVLPRIMAGNRVTADDLAALSQDGLYFNCPECTLPNYGFGEGI